MLSVQNPVKTMISNKLLKEKNAPYYGKNLYFTSVKDVTPTKFPTLSVNSLGEPSANSGLNPGEQRYILSTIELKSYSDKLNDASSLINSAGDVMLGMNYELIYGPESLSDKSPYCVVARFRRIFSSADVKRLELEAKKPIE